ncbi:MAG: hypothetical protein AAF612_00710 [Planctomycetota bacterium]
MEAGDVGAHGHDALGVEGDGLEDVRRGAGDGEVGVALEPKDLEAGVLGGLEEAVALGGVLDGLAAGLGRGEGGELGFAVFADDVRAQVFGVDADLVAQQLAEAQRVDQRARADHPGGLEARQLDGEPGQRVDRVAHDHDDGVWRNYRKRGYEVGEEPGVGVGQVIAVGHVGRRRRRGAQSDKLGALRGVEAAGGDFGRAWRERRGVAEVEGVALGLVGVPRNEHQLVGETLEQHGVGEGGADAAEPVDNDLHGGAPRACVWIVRGPARRQVVGGLASRLRGVTR